MTETNKRNEELQTHKVRLRELRRELSQLNDKVLSGDYDTDTLHKFGSVYQEYVKARTGHYG